MGVNNTGGIDMVYSCQYTGRSITFTILQYSSNK